MRRFSFPCVGISSGLTQNTASVLGPHSSKKSKDCLQKMRRIAPCVIKGHRQRTYKQRLRDLDLFSLGRRKVQGDLIDTPKTEGYLEFVPRPSFMETSIPEPERTKKVMKHHSRLTIRVRFFIKRLGGGWNKPARGTVNIHTDMTLKVELGRKWNELRFYIYILEIHALLLIFQARLNRPRSNRFSHNIIPPLNSKIQISLALLQQLGICLVV